jgi:2-phospho-L-lactate guanylyltransferase (CobY/MobA/RfbA family)
VPAYIMALRSALDAAGHTGTRIVAADGNIGSAAAVFTKNRSIAASLAGGSLGAHCECDHT